MKKFLSLAVLVGAVAVAVGVFYLLANLDSLVEAAIEDNGSAVTSTRVAVDGVEISLRDGRGSIRGLSIDSPEGYEAGEAFSLGDITIDLDLESVREDPIVIEEVKILAPFVRVEFDDKGNTNIDALRRKVDAYTGGGSGDGSDAGKSSQAPKIRIRHFLLAEGRVAVDASALGIEAREIELPAIELRDVGGSGGATPDQIAKEILSSVAGKVTRSVARSEIDRLIRAKVEPSLTDRAKRLIDRISN